MNFIEAGNDNIRSDLGSKYREIMTTVNENFKNHEKWTKDFMKRERADIEQKGQHYT